MAKKNKGLGMGLEGLLGEDPVVLDRGEETADPTAAGTAIALDQIRAGKYQPRDDFDETALQSLAESITEHGVMQPIVLRPLQGGDAANGPYEIIAGERRFRAAGLAGLTTIPALIRTANDEQALAMALIENIQREDLNALEEAKAIQQLIDEFGYTHDTAAKAIGRSRSATTNLVRLLNLSAPVQTMLIDGELDMGHARALLVLPRADQVMLAHRIVERGLSVRDAEQQVSEHLANRNDGASDQPSMRKAGSNARPDRDLMRLQSQLSDLLATSVTIRANRKGRGKLVMEFSSTEHFDGLLGQLGLKKKLDQ